MSEDNKVSITVLLAAGRLPLEVMEAAHKLAKTHSLGVYLSNLQNLRLVNVPESAVDEVKTELARFGVSFKAPGLFPVPKVCIGEGHCKLGLSDPEELSTKILDAFSSREKTKAKFKIAISACTMCCSNTKTTDIGVMATRNGYEIFAGGKSGPFPKVGRRIVKQADEEKVLETIGKLVDFHDKKTEKKQRMYKLLSDPEFPFEEL